MPANRAHQAVSTVQVQRQTNVLPAKALLQDRLTIAVDVTMDTSSTITTESANLIQTATTLVFSAQPAIILWPVSPARPTLLCPGFTVASAMLDSIRTLQPETVFRAIHLAEDVVDQPTTSVSAAKLTPTSTRLPRLAHATQVIH